MKIKNLIDIKTLFFDNKTTKQTIFKNTFWLALSSGISSFLSFFLVIYIARALGPTRYGEFSFALAFILFFSIFANFGLSRIVIRELSQGKEREKDYPSLLSLKLLLVLGTLAAIFISAFFITSDPSIRKVIWILAGYVLIGNFAQVLYDFLEAHQQMEYESLAKILETILHTIFGFFVILNFPSVENLAYGYLASILFFLIFLLTFFHLKIYRLHFRWDKFIWRKYLKMSWPLALTAFFATIYGQAGLVMMGYFGQITQTGWYNAAYGIVSTVIIPPSIICTSFFPALSKTFKEAKEKFQKIWDYQLEIMISYAIPLMAGGLFLAPRIIDYIYDPSFIPSILAFRILIIMAGIIIFYTTFHWILIIANQQKKIFLVGLIGAVINIILNLILIPKYSLYGVAVTMVVSYLLMFLLFFVFTFKFTAIKTFNLKLLYNLIGAIICSIIMYFVISRPIIYHFHILYLVMIGAGVYLICLYFYKKGVAKLLP